MPIGKIEQFDISSKKWLAYIRRVEQFMALNGIKPELQVATLVTLVGETTYDLMCDLCAPDNPETKTFSELVKTVGDHLEPKRSDIAERHIFRQRRQNGGESLGDYLQVLKHLASTCSFKSTLEENLRDQFVSGLASDDMRSRLFAEPTLTYQRAVELAFALEAADRHAQASGTGSATATTGPGTAEPVHRLATGRGGGGGTRAAPGHSGGNSAAAAGAAASDAQRAHQPCWRCGKGHRAIGCRFRNYSCDACGQKGHLKVMCRRYSRKGETSSSGRDQNYIDSDDDSECGLYNLNVCNNSDRPYNVRARVNGKVIMFELDTGSKLSTINTYFYDEHFKQMPLIANDLCLHSYNGTRIEVAGYIIVDVEVGTHTARNLKLFVIKNGGPPLLGRSWLSQLNIDKIKINEMIFNLSDLSLVESLRNEFPTVFAPGLGTCTKQLSLRLRDTAPIFMKARQLPLALRKPVELELQRLEAEGTIHKVEYSDYGTPIVPVIKKSGDIRICGDYKVTINPKLIRDPYPMPRIEELFAALSGGEQYSKIDLTNAYQQLLLDESSRACSAITTHVGTYVYDRTPFGLTCIPEKFQKFMEETLRGLKGTAVFLDDIAVTGSDRAEHLVNLRAVLSRLREVGLRIKLNKCSFMQDSITYLGFVIDKQGLHPDQNKIKAIVDAPPPEDVTQLRSFLGLINYYSKFIPRLSTILHPLHSLLRKDIEWVWSAECKKAFDTIKSVILSSKVLVHYNPELPLVLAVDSSSYGIGSVLSHRFPNGDERPICFASRTLNAAERSYSQLDKEALAIIAGVIKHHQYIYGRHFIIKTDHKPLTFIFGPKFGLPVTAASRLQRYGTRLASYDFDIEFVKSNDNSNVDALSRLPLPTNRKTCDESDSVSYINYVEESFPISAKEVALWTQKDIVLNKIKTYLINGWPSNITSELEKPYLHRKDNLCIDQGCILYNHRVIVPEFLRKQVLAELHEGHLGVVKMKNIARSYVYWPSLDAQIELIAKECSACRQQRDAPPRSLLHPWAFPARPWQRIHIDFGEFQGKHYLVSVDAHSKWIEVQKMSGTNAAATIGKLRELFARFGLPSQVVSDGGPPFGSGEFANFMKKNLITHTITSPYRPAGNGAAENAVKLVKRAMKKAAHENVDVDTAITKFLFQYRNCSHATTGVAPAEAMLGRRLRSRLDVLRPSAERASEAAADRAARSAPGTERSAAPGDPVLARDYSARADKWAPAVVTAREAPLTYRVRCSDGREWKRHIDQLLPAGKPRSTLRHSLAPVAPENADPGRDEKFEDAVERLPEVKSPKDTSSVIPNREIEPKPIQSPGVAQSAVRPKRACTFKEKFYKV